jgi:hypothetical protein
MRIRRNILATAILTMGTLGSIAAPAVVIATSAAAPVAAVADASPNVFAYHG